MKFVYRDEETGEIVVKDVALDMQEVIKRVYGIEGDDEVPS